MATISLSYLNIALDSFGLAIVFIIFATCFGELIRKRSGSKYFLFLLVFVMLAISSNIVGWIGEGHIELSMITLIVNTVSSSALRFAIICFMGYLTESLYTNSAATAITLKIFRILCIVSVLFSIGNAFFGYAFTVNDMGHYQRTDNVAMGILYLLFPILSFFAIIFMAIFATHTARINRVVFIIYTLFPVAGILLDYTIHGLSLTYVGLTLSIMIIYTNIYLQNKRIVDLQRNALMLSQINPHFMYNTLSTIASMCDILPKQAKALTIDFSRYLRQNLDSLMSVETIPFETELNHVECYLKIEKARFKEKLNVVYSVQSKDFCIPPLSVQPIVENAVKHGITQKAEGGTIKISSYHTDSHYVIEIKDDGVGFDTSAAIKNEKTHVGIENVRSRIRTICKGDVTVKSIKDVGTRVTIEIPRKIGKNYEHISS